MPQPPVPPHENPRPPQASSPPGRPITPTVQLPPREGDPMLAPRDDVTPPRGNPNPGIGRTLRPRALRRPDQTPSETPVTPVEQPTMPEDQATPAERPTASETAVPLGAAALKEEPKTAGSPTESDSAQSPEAAKPLEAGFTALSSIQELYREGVLPAQGGAHRGARDGARQGKISPALGVGAERIQASVAAWRETIPETDTLADDVVKQLGTTAIKLANTGTHTTILPTDEIIQQAATALYQEARDVQAKTDVKSPVRALLYNGRTDVDQAISDAQRAGLTPSDIKAVFSRKSSSVVAGIQGIIANRDALQEAISAGALEPGVALDARASQLFAQRAASPQDAVARAQRYTADVKLLTEAFADASDIISVSEIRDVCRSSDRAAEILRTKAAAAQHRRRDTSEVIREAPAASDTPLAYFRQAYRSGAIPHHGGVAIAGRLGGKNQSTSGAAIRQVITTFTDNWRATLPAEDSLATEVARRFGNTCAKLITKKQSTGVLPDNPASLRGALDAYYADAHHAASYGLRSQAAALALVNSREEIDTAYQTLEAVGVGHSEFNRVLHMQASILGIAETAEHIATNVAAVHAQLSSARDVVPHNDIVDIAAGAKSTDEAIAQTATYAYSYPQLKEQHGDTVAETKLREICRKQANPGRYLEQRLRHAQQLTETYGDSVAAGITSQDIIACVLSTDEPGEPEARIQACIRDTAVIADALGGHFDEAAVRKLILNNNDPVAAGRNLLRRAEIRVPVDMPFADMPPERPIQGTARRETAAKRVLDELAASYGPLDSEAISGVIAAAKQSPQPSKAVYAAYAPRILSHMAKTVQEPIPNYRESVAGTGTLIGVQVQQMVRGWLHEDVPEHPNKVLAAARFGKLVERYIRHGGSPDVYMNPALLRAMAVESAINRAHRPKK